MSVLNDKEYQCDLCGGVFGLVIDETWNENKANQEYKEVFPGCSPFKRQVVCDDCWKIVKPFNAKSS